MVGIPERYSRQANFIGIGEEGQKRLGNARVAVIGTGALGTVIANNLARAGIGYLRLVDRDFVEISNLQRQTLFDEADVKQRVPKAAAAVEHLKRVNSEIVLEAVISDVNASNIEQLIRDVDIVMDGTDNFETRLLLNDACVKLGIPWIYGGALGSYGMSMNIIPGETPCFRCFMPHLPAPGSQPTCSSAGVLNMITGIVSCFETAEAVKYLIKSPNLRKEAVMVDIWGNVMQLIEVERNKDCKVCVQGEYEFLDNRLSSYTTSLCGSDAVQVVPQFQGKIDLKAMNEKLGGLGEVTYNRFMLRFAIHNLEITLFPDGRAIIKGVTDPNVAKSVYSEYIGL